MPIAPPKQAQRRRWWAAGRWTILAAAVGLAWPWRAEAWIWTTVLLPSLSPFVAVGGALAARSVNLLAALALPVLGLAWFFPRVFPCQKNAAPSSAWRRSISTPA